MPSPDAAGDRPSSPRWSSTSSRMCGSSSTTSTRGCDPCGCGETVSVVAIVIQSTALPHMLLPLSRAVIIFSFGATGADTVRPVFMSMKRRTTAAPRPDRRCHVTAGAFYSRRGDAAPQLTTAPVTRGSVVTVVSATGTLQPVTTVEVGGPGYRDHRVAERRFQLNRPQGPGAGDTRPVDDSHQRARAGAREPRRRAGRRRAPARRQGSRATWR